MTAMAYIPVGCKDLLFSYFQLFTLVKKPIKAQRQLTCHRQSQPHLGMAECLSYTFYLVLGGFFFASEEQG